MATPRFLPSSRSEERARRAWTGPAAATGVLTRDIVAFCESGVSIALASRDDDGFPLVGRGLACRIDNTGKVRLVLRADCNRGVLLAVERGAGFAATFTQPTTHRSLQLKGIGARSAETNLADRRLAKLQTAILRADLVKDGFWDAFAERYCAFEPNRLAAIEFVPVQAFVQTPGPGAGSPLQP